MRSLRFCVVLAVLVACCSVAHATPMCTGTGTLLNCSGTIPYDMFVEVIAYMTPTAGTVTVTTTSFASPILNGFAPILSLYTPDFNLQNSAQTANGTNLDTSLSWNADAWTMYYVAISEADNTSGTFLVSDSQKEWQQGFSRYQDWVSDGSPEDATSETSPGRPIPLEYLNFTASANKFFQFTPGLGSAFLLQGAFYDNGDPLTGNLVDPSGNNAQRTGNWALTIEGPDGIRAGEAPEPSTMLFWAGGLAMLAGMVRFRRRS